MPKVKISEYSSTANSNTDVASINIDEGCAPSGINNAIRAVMGHLKDFQTGAVSDPLTVGGVLTVTGGSAGTPAITTSGDTNTGIFFPAADTIAFSEGGTESARIDSAGNFGLGVTPSAWGSNFKAIQVNALYGGSLSTSSAGNTFTHLSHGAYNSNTNWLYGATGFGVARYEMEGPSGGGTHKWFTAASGTAGNAITFTQAMTLDASGNLGVGTTSPAYPLDVVGASSGGWTLNMRGRSADNIGYMRFSSNNGAITYAAIGTPAANTLAIEVNGSERARINSSGNFLINNPASNYGTLTVSSACNTVKTGFAVANTDAGAGTFVGFINSAGNVAGSITQTGTTTVNYGTSSDYRLKDNSQPMTGALAKVAQLKPVTYTWKNDGLAGEGFIAHELQEVVPQCVVGGKDEVDADGKPVYQTIDVSFLVATLTAAIQEQQALITQLQADVAALKA
jgi:hypothetical protein